MAANYVQDASHINYVNAGTAILSGEIVIDGKITGVALVDIAATTGEGTIQIDGVWRIAKTASLVVAQGDAVYYNTTTKKITKTATDKFIGYAVKAEASSTTTVDVLLQQDAALANLPVVAAVADIATANGSDAATTQALANATKAKVNELLAALRTAAYLTT